jgi:phage terminase large subunit-like protein
MAEDARRMPSREAEYRNLILNQRVEMNAPFISRRVWQECGGPVVNSFKGLPVFGGLDLSEVNDLTALVLVAPVDGVWNVRPTFWLPGANLADRSRTDRVPYDQWAKESWLQTTPGATVDYEFVATDIAAITQRMNVVTIAYDRWRIDLLKRELEQFGVELPLTPYGQGFKDMSPALDAMEAELLNGRVAHGAHPVLTMCAASAVTQRDPAGNRKLDKHKATGRIDGLVALAMAFGAQHLAEHTEDIDGFLNDPIMV